MRWMSSYVFLFFLCLFPQMKFLQPLLHNLRHLHRRRPLGTVNPDRIAVTLHRLLVPAHHEVADADVAENVRHQQNSR